MAHRNPVGAADGGPARQADFRPPAGPELDRWRDAAAEIAVRAGRLLGETFAGVHEEDCKGHEGNLVTEADRASEALIVSLLRERFPAHAVRAEEGGGGGSHPVTWLVDPLDGTNNFAHAFPVFAVTIAAAHGDLVLAGVTYDPLRDELFAARLGGGATLNGRRLAVSTRDRLSAALVATGFPYDKGTNPDNNLAQFCAVTPLVRGVRRCGSAALDLAYVAAGRLDAYWERGTAAWDVAAGLLLVQEAGGRVTDYDGAAARLDGGRFVASNDRIHDPLLERLQWASKSTAS